MDRTTLALALFLAVAAAAPAQQDGAGPERAVDPESAEPLDVAEAVARGCELLVKMQEGHKEAEWPYEGVYRVRGQIPIGYRVGGTAIAALALIESPGYGKDQPRQQAVAKAVGFILDALEAPLMSSGFKGGYDVRGWGHAYALLFFLRLQDAGLEPEGSGTKVARSVKWLVKTLQETEIKKNGGWNYARRGSRAQASPFMTAPTLQALFHARARKHHVETAVIRRAVRALEKARTKAGGYAYSSASRPYASKPDDELSFMHKLPGAIARTAGVEATLMLAGRGSVERLRASIEAFFTHWRELEKRRRKTGTHEPPYGVAPYYFMYGHYYVAQAIEMLPGDQERAKHREHLNRTLAAVREPDGSWNDRVFDRSANYGTAMAIMALRMKDLPAVPAWKSKKRF